MSQPDTASSPAAAAPPAPDAPPRPATLDADPSVPRLGSQIVSVWRRSAAAEGNPFHTCFSRVPIVTSDAPAQPVRALPADAPSPPPETCPEDDLVRLPSGKTAVRLLSDGLSGSADWHRDRQVTERLTLRQPTDRSVLIQTKEHLAELTARFPALADSFNRPTSFGENLLISGELTAKTLCIGDVLHIVRPGAGGAADEVVGVLQVSNPRLPCFKVDYKHKTSQPGQPPADATVRGTCAASGLAGFFCRVLQGGSVAAGDRLVLAQRHRPQWTLAGLSELMYGGRNARQAELRVWRGTEEQLHALMEEKLLGWFEWRHALHKFVERREKLAAEVEAEERAEEAARAAEARAREAKAEEAARAAMAAAQRTTQLQVAISVASIAVIAFFVLKERSLI